MKTVRIVSAILLCLGFLMEPSRVRAQSCFITGCIEGQPCDFECLVAEENARPGDDDVRNSHSRSPGGEIGVGFSTVVTPSLVSNLTSLVSIPGIVLSPGSIDDATNDLIGALDLEGIVDEVRDGAPAPRTPPEPGAPPVGTSPFPFATGPERSVAASGDANDNEASSVGEPVNPYQGEFVIEQVDLAFPGFGVPFVHTRTYRSRTAYNGRLGHGWDHSYNQRLFEARTSPVPIPIPEPGDEMPGSGESIPSDLGIPTVLMDDLDLGADGSDCGRVLLYTTGQATTLRFREITVPGGDPLDILYESGGLELSLRGRRDGDQITWFLTRPSGIVSEFDANGLLVSIQDPNGIGIEFEWEPGESRTLWRLARATDSVGRIIEYEHNQEDRLERVHEASSGLEAIYAYNLNDELEVATNAQERTETYRYDFDSSRGRGDWTPQDQLVRGCELACAPASSSCDAGGACDEIVEHVEADCLLSCGVCNSECRVLCDGPTHIDGSCKQLCSAGADGEPGCSAACTTACAGPDVLTEIEQSCEDVWDEGIFELVEPIKDICNNCDNECDDNKLNSRCRIIGACVASTGGIWIPCVDWDLDASVSLLALLLELLLGGGFDDMCDTNYVKCCADGQKCATGSCNAGHKCETDCKRAFFGPQYSKPTGSANNCLSPERDIDCIGLYDPNNPPYPLAGTEPYTDALACVGSMDDYAEQNGCIGNLQQACPGKCSPSCVDDCADDCRPVCFDACEEGCHVSDCGSFCASLDIPGECGTACETGCIENSLMAGGPSLEGPKYGHYKDLNHNLTEILNGNGDRYLLTEYGTDILSPDFDAVVNQDFGGHTVDIFYRDLASEAAGFAVPPTTGPTAEFVDASDEFETVVICPFTCDRTGNPGEFVPWGDTLLEFAPVEGVPGGYSTLPIDQGDPDLTLAVLQLSEDRHGLLATTVAKGSTETPPVAAGKRPIFDVSLPSGDAEFRPKGLHSYQVRGTESALQELAAVGELTVLSDAGGTLRVYPGHPLSVLFVATGECSAPFIPDSIGSADIALDPPDVCSNDLLITPLATAVTGSLAETIRASGQSALENKNVFRPTMLVPDRTAWLWTSIPGGLSSRWVDDDATALPAASAAIQLTEHTGLFGAPVAADHPARPVFVFHVPEDAASFAGGDAIGGLLLDDPSGDGGIIVDPFCNPELPQPPVRGSGESAPGPVPIRATVEFDFYGIPWTYYFDRRGQLLRQVNNETGAVYSYNYDLLGRLIGVESPLGARACLSYDRLGNVTDAIQFPEPGAVGSTQPIWQRLDYTDVPVRIAAIYDPRSATFASPPTAVLQSAVWDSQGNPVSVTDATGASTTFTLVGGTGPDRTAPEKVTGPDDSVTEIEYDIATGRVHRVITDATGDSPLVRETVADAAGRIVWSKSPLGEILTRDFAGGRLQSITRDADGLFEFVELSYDANGQIDTVSRGDRATSYTYHRTGAIQTVTHTGADGSVPPAVSCFDSGADGRVLEVVRPMGDRSRVSYDTEGRIIRVERGSLSGDGGAWDDACAGSFEGSVEASGIVYRAEHDLNGRVIVQVDAAGAPVFIEYDGFSRPAIVTDGEGTSYRTGFDATGNAVWAAVYAPSGAGAPYDVPSFGEAGLVAAGTAAYDSIGRLAERDNFHFDDIGAVGDGLATTLFAYDVANRRSTVTDDLGEATVVETDGAGRHKRTLLPSGDEIVSEYSADGRVIQRSRTAPTPSGWSTFDLRLTPWGAPELLTTSDAGGGTTLGKWTYDAHRRLLSHRDVGGKEERIVAYDAFDRPLVIEAVYGDDSIETTSLAWDRNDWLIRRLSDPGGVVAATSYDWDALGRVRREVRPGDTPVVMNYHQASRLPGQIFDARGTEFQYSYDFANRLTQIRTVDDVGGIIQLRNFARDSLGRVETASRLGELPTWVGATEIHTFLSHDSLGNKIAESDSTFGASGAIEHTYDGRGLAVESTLGPHAVARSYDALGRLAELRVDGASAPAVEFQHAGLGGPTQRRYETGVNATYDYDPLGRLVGTTEVRDGSEIVAQWRWEVGVDSVPRLAGIQRESRPEVASVFQVDFGGRLAAENHGLVGMEGLSVEPDAPTSAANLVVDGDIEVGGAWQRYALDGRHNWTSLSGPDGIVLPDPDVADLYQGLGLSVPVYDSAGALLDDGEMVLAYDSYANLVGVSVPLADREYARDAFGRIVLERDPETGDVTRYGHDGTARVLRKSATGAIDVTIPGPGIDEHLLRIDASGDRVYYHQERQRSVYLVTDEDGLPVEWYSYSAYGEVSISDDLGAVLTESAIDNRFGFQGHSFDAHTGLVDMRARSYRPDWGRFVMPDPIGYGDGPNMFAFVGSAPLAWLDPLGLAALELSPDRTVTVFTPNPNYGDFTRAVTLDSTQVWHRVAPVLGGFEIEYTAGGADHKLIVPRGAVDWNGGAGYGQVHLPGNVIAPSRITAKSSPKIHRAILEIDNDLARQANGGIAAMKGFNYVLNVGMAQQIAVGLFKGGSVAATEGVVAEGGSTVEGVAVAQRVTGAGEAAGGAGGAAAEFGPFTHFLNKGGMSDIVSNGRLVSTEASAIAGGGAGVRAYTGSEVAGATLSAEAIEFTTTLAPAWRGLHMGESVVRWNIAAGNYLKVTVQRIFHTDGSITIFFP